MGLGCAPDSPTFQHRFNDTFVDVEISLRALGCHDAQGFWLGRPLSEEDARRMCDAEPAQGRRLVA